jgi:integrase
LDLLHAVKQGELHISEVLAADREDKLDTLTGDTRVVSQNLWDAIDTWVEASPDSKTRKRHSVSLRAFRSRGPLKKESTIGDLAGIDWEILEKEWPRSGSDWNHLRKAVSKFLSDSFDDVHHQFRRAVMKDFPKRAEVERVPDISPALFWKIVHAAPAHVRASYVVLAHLGLDTGEYLELSKDHLRPNTSSIEAPGTKTFARHGTLRVDPRLWDWIERGVPSQVQYKRLRIHWKRALAAVKADTTLRLKDLRHCPAQWATDEGMAEAKVQVFMRHTNPNMTRRYSKQKDRGEVARAVADAMLRSA